MDARSFKKGESTLGGTTRHGASVALCLGTPRSATTLLARFAAISAFHLRRSSNPPFEPTRVETPDGPELHARGAIDDKGNVAFHLLGIRAHLAATGRDTPAVTVKLIVEKETMRPEPIKIVLKKS